MNWISQLPFAVVFSIFVALILGFVAWGGKMKARSPRAFRSVKIFDFATSVILVLELARTDKDVDDALSDPTTSGQVVSDVARSLKDDSWLILAYILMFLTGAQMARLRSGSDIAAIIFGLLAILAGGMDFWENYGIWRAIQKAEPGRAARIRRPSLIKWSALGILSVSLGITLFFFSGTGSDALMACIAGCLVLAIGSYCGWLLWKWSRSSGAAW